MEGLKLREILEKKKKIAFFQKHFDPVLVDILSQLIFFA